jgi:hypothetical protein
VKCILILQEFNLEFVSSKSKKSLDFVELMLELPHDIEEPIVNDFLPDEHLFLISTTNPWYGDVSSNSKVRFSSLS